MKKSLIKSTLSFACAIALTGILSACSSSSSSTDSSSTATTTTESAGVIPADIANNFFIAYCDKNQGTLDPTTNDCKTSDGSTSKIDVTMTDPTSAAMVLQFAYSNPDQKDIAGCPTAAEINDESASTPPAVSLDCQIEAIKEMTVSLSQ